MILTQRYRLWQFLVLLMNDTVWNEMAYDTGLILLRIFRLKFLLCRIFRINDRLNSTQHTFLVVLNLEPLIYCSYLCWGTKSGTAHILLLLVLGYYIWNHSYIALTCVGVDLNLEPPIYCSYLCWGTKSGTAHILLLLVLGLIFLTLLMWHIRVDITTCN